MVFNSRIDLLNDGAVRRYRIADGRRRIAYGEALELWRGDEIFRSFFVSLLAEAPFTAYRWETPPVAATNLDRPFEFALLNSPGLAVPPDPSAFASHFESDEGRRGVIVFPNLAGDAELIVPLQRGPISAYAHIAAFSREAPADQRHALWVAVGAEMEKRIGDRPVWLSTAGGAVPWLHVRLDSRPKYYGFRAYKMDV